MTESKAAGDRREFEALLEDYDTALFTTRGADGHFHTRPMAMQKKRQSSEQLWFVTSEPSHKVTELEDDAHCSVALYAGGHSSTYVSISGTAELVRDRKTIHALWEPSWKAWFPKGPDSEEIVLVCFHPEHAEYVHPKSGLLTVLFTVVKNVLTKERSQPTRRRELDLDSAH